MASWCWICHRKVSYDYVYYKKDKCHKGCMKIKKEQEAAKKLKEDSKSPDRK